MRRRQMLDGKRLIELPNKQVDLVRLEFSKEERDIYNMVRSLVNTCGATLTDGGCTGRDEVPRDVQSLPPRGYCAQVSISISSHELI